MIDLKTFRFHKALLLAPMEDVTDISYRLICKEMGAEMVYTEFVNSDGLVRGSKRGMSKILLSDEERPAGIQLYGNNHESMLASTDIACQLKPDVLDVNAGCWVKKVSTRGAGAGLLKDPCFMQKMVAGVVRQAAQHKVPVSVKTRIGWDADFMPIVEVAQRLESVGVKAITVHCRTRAQGHSGEPDWTWIEKVKRAVSIPIILNGGILSAHDALRAFDTTPADGIMIARGAIGRPWIFREITELLNFGSIRIKLTFEKQVAIALRHLQAHIALKGENFGVRSFRKYYSGYLKGFPNVAKLRLSLMSLSKYHEVESMLENFASQLQQDVTASLQDTQAAPLAL